MLWYQKHRVIDHGIIGECTSRIVPVQLELAGAHRPGWGAAVRHPTAPAGSRPATGLRCNMPVMRPSGLGRRRHGPSGVRASV
jgi:hypothetical protein